MVNKLLNIFSKELVNTQKIEYIIGSLPAEARVAKFLLSLGQKYAQLGYSDNSYNLKMTRNESVLNKSKVQHWRGLFTQTA